MQISPAIFIAFCAISKALMSVFSISARAAAPIAWRTTWNDALFTQAAKEHRYVLLDSVDWMDAPMLTELWEQIRRTARPGARMICRTAGARSPLSHMVPAEMLEGWRYHEADSKRYLEQDRSAIYGGFHLYSRIA